MKDPFGRGITYVRVSVTDRCDLRCVYCMTEDAAFAPKKDLLSLAELDRICSAFVSLGVRKLRITGGEPLVRRDVMSLFESLGQHLKSGALGELTLTTNATRLEEFAAPLHRTGVRRVNISLDSLDPGRFKAITRSGDHAAVLRGIAAAQAAGLKVKINTVALRGVNEDEFDDLVAWCGDRGFDLVFIEVMPMGEIDGHKVDQYLPLSLVRAKLARRWTLEPIADMTGGPARYTRCTETRGRVGFITPMTHNFCELCNRVRLTCTGQLYMCLGQEDSADLRAAVRESNNDTPLINAITEAIARKPKGHDFIIDRRRTEPSVNRGMNVTGG